MPVSQHRERMTFSCENIIMFNPECIIKKKIQVLAPAVESHIIELPEIGIEMVRE